jgi:molybdopterin molybdotransferase
MAPLSVEDALEQVTAGITPLDSEPVAIETAHGRVLAQDISARITHPPFDSSSMDGYAVRASDVAELPRSLRVIGEAGAGHAFDGEVKAGQALRIFTGAPLPKGADTVVIQENTDRQGDEVTVRDAGARGDFIRPTGMDFEEGDVLLRAGRRLTARDVTLAVSTNNAKVPVRRRPKVAILSTGDELVPPGETPRPDQIISSNGYGIAAIVERAGGQAILAGIAKDTLESLGDMIESTREADILVTIGGASVGEHDLVQKALEAHGLSLNFWKIAMRPGKPLMFGQMAGQRVLGVPGNSVSALLCARLFLVPMITRLLGQSAEALVPLSGELDCDIEANGPRQHYMRATWTPRPGALPLVAPVKDQDSSLLALLAAADCLIIRPPNAPAATKGEQVSVMSLDF